MEHRRTALITGASAGIGKAFVNLLAKDGYDLVLVARRRDLLEQLAARMREQHNVGVTVMPTDLADIGAARDIARQVEEKGLFVDVLVNNAGFASSKAFSQSSWPEIHGERQVMITALTELCHSFAPAVIDQGQGGITNLSSIAACALPTSSLLHTGVRS